MATQSFPTIATQAPPSGHISGIREKIEDGNRTDGEGRAL
jgi:hypothetical protein